LVTFATRPINKVAVSACFPVDLSYQPNGCVRTNEGTKMNLVKNLKLWLCEDCGFDFQAVEPFRAATGENVCLECCSDSFKVGA
jgi:hypothetical protein